MHLIVTLPLLYFSILFASPLPLVVLLFWRWGAIWSSWTPSSWCTCQRPWRGWLLRGRHWIYICLAVILAFIRGVCFCWFLIAVGFINDNVIYFTKSWQFDTEQCSIFDFYASFSIQYDYLSTKVHPSGLPCEEYLVLPVANCFHLMQLMLITIRNS